MLVWGHQRQGARHGNVVGLDGRGAIVLRQKCSRGQVEARFANMPPCLIGMEACVGAHPLSRRLQRLGHDARLMPAPLRPRATPVNDMFATGGYLREDGRMVHDMYLAQIKTPAESTGPLDLVKILKTVRGEEAFRPLADSECSLIDGKDNRGGRSRCRTAFADDQGLLG
jgi:hypothetical protein